MEMGKNNKKDSKKANGKEKEKSNEKGNEKGDLAIVLFNFIASTSDELTLRKNEYIMVTNWNIGDDYAFGYKRNSPQKKGKFPSPLVRKCFENKGFFFKLDKY